MPSAGGNRAGQSSLHKETRITARRLRGCLRGWLSLACTARSPCDTPLQQMHDFLEILVLLHAEQRHRSVAIGKKAKRRVTPTVQTVSRVTSPNKENSIRHYELRRIPACATGSSGAASPGSDAGTGSDIVRLPRRKACFLSGSLGRLMHRPARLMRRHQLKMIQ